VSKSVADHAINSGLPREKVHVIANGIDAEACHQVEPVDWSTIGVSPEHRVILFIGRLEAQKGPDLLLEAAATFVPILPQYDVVFIGEGPSRRDLMLQVERRGLDRRIHFAGWRGDAASYIAAADLVVIPSRYEGMSNVLLESMAAGKPVLAATVEGVAELLGPLAPRQTCAANDSAALANAVIEILRADSVQKANLGEANRTRVVEYFSLTQMLDAYAMLYLDAIAEIDSAR
jgi:glycosyltransferase involved in cell wall biosynthesis